MGREKRIAESRAKEMMDTKPKAPSKASERATPAASAPSGASIAAPYAAPTGKVGTSTGKALFQIFLLYVVPVVIIILVGKLIFKL